jgi:hypothetical protein
LRVEHVIVTSKICIEKFGENIKDPSLRRKY